MDRAAIQSFLETKFPNVSIYFQPPDGFQMEYPCIVYTLSKIESEFSDNIPYLQNSRYTITVMDQDPDSNITKEIAKLPLSRHERHFVVAQLHHDIFNVYFN